MVVSKFSAKIISKGFSESTGLKIRIPVPDDGPRRCSICGDENCSYSAARRRQRGESVFDPLWDLTRPHSQTGASQAAPTPAAVPETTSDTTPEVINLDINDLFSMTCMTSYPSTPTDGEQETRVHIHIIKENRLLSVVANPSSTVKELRKEAADQLGWSPRHLMLILDSCQLDDHEEIRYLNIGPDSTILGMKCTPGQRLGAFELDPATLDPGHDFDFTDMTDDGQTYLRGGHVYHRPYGWKRYAVKVHGKYEDDIWLGADGIRTESTPGEWAVSYHGTARRNVRPILEEGYRIGKGALFGPAVYTSPILEKLAETEYVREFECEGKTYKFALQNRVNPKQLKIIPPEQTGTGFPYWLSPGQDPQKGRLHVRPYGILTREVKLQAEEPYCTLL